MALSFNNPKEYIAELFGTAVLIAMGCLFATLVGGSFSTAVGVAVAYVGLVYCIGNLCNCHFNPLITLSMLVNKKMDASDSLWYILAQIIGGILGAIFAFYMVTQRAYTDMFRLFPSLFGVDYGIDWVGAIIAEFFFAFVLSYVALKASETKKIDVRSGAIIAVAMFGLIYVGYNMTATMVNPAKSIGTAIAMLFSGVDKNTDALIQLWLFVIVPVLGALFASLVFLIVSGGDFDVKKFTEGVKNIKKKKEPAEGEETADEEVSEETVPEEQAEEPAEEVAEAEPAEEVPADDIPEIESIEEEAVEKE